MDPLGEHERWLNTEGKEGMRFLLCDHGGMEGGWSRVGFRKGTNLSRANLSQAKLNHTNLSGINLSGAILSNADLLRANLNGTT